MSEITYNVGGRLMTASQLKASAPKPKAKPKAEQKAFHKGWAVEGHRVADIEAAKKAAGEKWDELAYLRKHKAKRVRTKPYEVASAADECAAIARRSGWVHVQVVALTAGTAGGGF